MRVVTYNVHGWTGWPPGAYGESEPRELFKLVGELIGEALAEHEPDIVTLSEAPPSPALDALARALGMRVVVFASSWCWPGILLTGYEVREAASYSLDRGMWSRALFTRHWGRCVLETEFGEVVVHSVHLHPNSRSRVHRLEVHEVLRCVGPELGAGLSVLVQGDLNHDPSEEVYAEWLRAGLTDAFASAGVGRGETFKVGELTRRIDYILVGGELAKRIAECRVLSDPPFNVGADGRALSDHLPLLAIFK